MLYRFALLRFLRCKYLARVLAALKTDLFISIAKCNTLSTGKTPVDAQFHFRDTGLPQLSHCRDLGVVITSDLSCSLHIQQICVKAHQRANNILRCCFLFVRECQIITSCIYCICQTHVGIFSYMVTSFELRH